MQYETISLCFYGSFDVVTPSITFIHSCTNLVPVAALMVALTSLHVYVFTYKLCGRVCVYVVANMELIKVPALQRSSAIDFTHSAERNNKNINAWGPIANLCPTCSGNFLDGQKNICK